MIANSADADRNQRDTDDLHGRERAHQSLHVVTIARVLGTAQSAVHDDVSGVGAVFLEVRHHGRETEQLNIEHLMPMQVDVHRGRLHVPARTSKLVASLDKASGAAIKKRPKIVAPGTVARIVVEMDRAVPLEAPTRIVLRSGGSTVAAGLLE